MKHVAVFAFVLSVLAPLAPLAPAQEPSQPPISLQVDATQAPRRVFRAELSIPAKPGPLTLVYPKWIPGTHSPSNPINALVDLKLTAGGRPLAWRRDVEDMYAFHCDVPDGATTVTASFAFATADEASGFRGTMTSPKLAIINWWSVLLYPRGKPASELTYTVRLRLPDGWSHASALRPPDDKGWRGQATALEFAPVSLETLIDSPLLCGAHLRSIPLTEGKSPPHMLHLAADSAAALAIRPEYLQSFKRLIAEAPAMLGRPPYRKYDFLVALSDEVQHGGLEHHEASDNRLPERAMVDEPKGGAGGGGELLPHELAHAWNGKFRRPAGMATPDYHHAMHTELVWVYEGLTSYLGYVLGCRSGLVSINGARDRLAGTAAHMENQAGRNWRSLHDTAVAAPVLMGSPHEWRTWRRGTDFYPEGLLIWLEIDTIIRQKTNGTKSLDDFCHAFFGHSDGIPAVQKYQLEDLVAALGKVAAHDWKALIDARVKSVEPKAPLGGVANGGWKLLFKDKPSEAHKAQETSGRGGPTLNLAYSGGLILLPDGTVRDIVPGSAADRAGISPAMKILSVNGRKYTADLLKHEITATKDARRTIEIQVENEKFHQTLKMDYQGGLRYPHLQRLTDRPDLLADILKPRVTAPGTAPSTVSAPAETLENKAALPQPNPTNTDTPARKSQ